MWPSGQQADKDGKEQEQEQEKEDQTNYDEFGFRIEKEDGPEDSSNR